MSIKAFFVDFYGTVVHEDGEVIKKITKKLKRRPKVPHKRIKADILLV